MEKIKHALRLNPILNKELRLGSRSIKIPMFVMGYDIILALIAVVFVGGLGIASGEREIDFSAYLYIYQIIGWVQYGITLLIVPILTAGTISGERERQTLDIMLTTPKKPLSIIWGKLLAALSNYMIFLISSIPVMALAFILGGLNWFALLGYIFMTLVTAVYVGSIGIFCSAAFKRTIASVVMTFLIEIAMFAIPYVVFGMVAGIGSIIYEYRYENYMYGSAYTGTIPDLNFGILPLVIQLNPISGFFDYMMVTMNITSIHELIKDADVFGTIMPLLAYAWIPMNVVISIAISWFFIYRASVKLDPIKKKKKKKVQTAGATAIGGAGVPGQMAGPVMGQMAAGVTQPTPQLYQPANMQGAVPNPAGVQNAQEAVSNPSEVQNMQGQPLVNMVEGMQGATVPDSSVGQNVQGTVPNPSEVQNMQGTVPNLLGEQNAQATAPQESVTEKLIGK